MFHSFAEFTAQRQKNSPYLKRWVVRFAALGSLNGNASNKGNPCGCLEEIYRFESIPFNDPSARFVKPRIY